MVGAGTHVLVVEDDSSIRTVLVDLLQDNGYAVTTATDGAEALVAMRQRLPDLILLDLMLPRMSGWRFLEVRAGQHDLAGVPVLVLSASGAQGSTQAEEVGAPVFLAKPFVADELLKTVKRLSDAPVRQCAWCGRVMDHAGEFRLRSGRKLRWATQGSCPTCKEAQRREIAN
jgi:CheY-like chemotaxis protein